MRAERGVWRDVHKGSYIRDKTGVVWRVTHDERGHVGLLNRDNEKKLLERPAKTAAVDIMFLTQDELEEILAQEFGAKVHTVKRKDDHIYVCRPWNDGLELSEMKSHLLLMHGVSAISANDPGQSAGMNTKKQLTEAHVAAHTEPNDRWRPHVHADTIDHWRHIS